MNEKQTAGQLKDVPSDHNEAVFDESSEWPTAVTPAYLEAVERFGKDVDSQRFENGKLLLENLRVIGKDSTDDSAFKRGLEIMRSLRGSMDNIKRVLDFVAPLASLEPNTAVACNVMKSVMAVRELFV